jgi:hypothetical protein
MISCLLPLVFRLLDDPEVKTTVISGVLVTRHSYRCLWWTVCDDLLSISPFVRMILLNDMEVKTTVIGKWMSITCQKMHNLELVFVN